MGTRGITRLSTAESCRNKGRSHKWFVRSAAKEHTRVYKPSASERTGLGCSPSLVLLFTHSRV